MPGPSRPPAGVDTSRPNAARVWDCLLGGKDNFAADRDLAEALTDPARGGDPGLRALAREQRAFILRAVRWAAAHGGIAQFIDAGCGLPFRPYVHEAARSAEPSARVAYADPDPMVVRHVQALERPGKGWRPSRRTRGTRRRCSRPRPCWRSSTCAGLPR